MTSIPFSADDHPHRRWNPLLREWILVSPHRARRPWSGQVEPTPDESIPSHDPECYLCPGSVRASGERNPDYRGTYVFTNDFQALLPDAPVAGPETECHGLIRMAPEPGLCRVICFSPRHDLTLARMDVPGIRRVIETWRHQTEELIDHPEIATVTIFENRGEIMGCSNPHPHGQLWANHSIPTLQQKEIRAQCDYASVHQRPMLLDYIEWECERGERLLDVNDHFAALVPFWAVWPFETLIVPRRAMTTLGDLTAQEEDGWAEILHRLLNRYDGLFQVSFPYSMGIHQAPIDGGTWPGMVWHQHFFPPLLRSATVRKFQVGYEMAGEPQRDSTPEQAAARLRAAGV